MPSLFGKAPKLPEKSFDFSEEFDKRSRKPAAPASVSGRLQDRARHFGAARLDAAMKALLSALDASARSLGRVAAATP
jgi:hypothetical protein